MRATTWFSSPVAVLLLAMAALAAPMSAVAQGLNLVDATSPSSRWQTRLTLAGNGMFGRGTGRPQPLQAALLSDYDLGSFGLTLPTASGHFRATGGLLFDLADSNAGAIAPPQSAPYIGLGFSGWSAKAGLSFSADIGLSADFPGGAWRFGRAQFGNQAIDATWREMRLQPRLQLGVQYRY